MPKEMRFVRVEAIVLVPERHDRAAEELGFMGKAPKIAFGVQQVFRGPFRPSFRGYLVCELFRSFNAFTGGVQSQQFPGSETLVPQRQPVGQQVPFRHCQIVGLNG
jgi:hypothetical protein